MYLKEIDAIPDRNERYSREGNKNLKSMILDFYESPMEQAEIVFNHGEYSSSQSLYSGVRKAAAKLNLPIAVEYIQGGVYLRRTD